MHTHAHTCTQLYAQKFGSITGFKFLSDMILLSIVNKVCLPPLPPSLPPSLPLSLPLHPPMKFIVTLLWEMWGEMRL